MMDRQAHDYAAAAMAFAQQQQQANNTNVQQQQQQQQTQQQFGYHPQHQQYPQPVHGAPFMPPHPSLQQFPFHRHMAPPQQLQSHPPHPHLLHLQQQQQPPPAFPPHLPPPHVPLPPFHGGYDSVQPPPPPPSDPELQKCIDKLVEYSAKNGPEFEAMIREKQKDNPAYSFLFGGEGHNYYRYKLWISTRPPPPPPPSGLYNPPPFAPPPNSMMSNNNLSPLNSGPQMHQPPPFPPFYDQQQHPHSQSSFIRPEYDQSSSSRSFKGLAGPLPSDVAMELNNVLNSLSGTKESIKGAKIWFMQRSPFAPALAEALRDRMIALDDSERQLHIIYLANDILFESLQRRINPHELDNDAHAFKPVLGSMLARIYHNPQNKEDNQSRLQKILQFWESKEVFDHNTIRAFENEMMGGPPPPPNPFPGPQIPDPSFAGLSQLVSTHGSDPHANDKQVGGPILQGMLPPHQHQHQHHFLPPGATGFLGSMTMPPQPLAAANQQTDKMAAVAPPPPPYPLFPPGLIPGMVRKMQIGSGVPYSPMSPLDIPTTIPPSIVSPSQILERVSKFFKDIGEVNPSEGPMNQPPTTGGDENEDEYDDYEREREASFGRKGGACIPPPPNLQVVDPETGTYPDGSVEQKSGGGSGGGSSSSGRLGLGATSNPNEASQYDDVYSSYRKQRSTNYHSSMSARASATK